MYVRTFRKTVKAYAHRIQAPNAQFIPAVEAWVKNLTKRRVKELC
jgi:hypothetical protein